MTRFATAGGYYAAAVLGGAFGVGGLGVAAAWSAAGLAGESLLGRAGWTVRLWREAPPDAADAEIGQDTSAAVEGK
ncbi:hypothetical protein [Streptomyces sp. NPDC020965]|uniref:hypothetical protein n=1 Tax=Streptomyces sp. NPDC020965 TaxID=3365105 RepID=UPI003791C22C